MEIEEYKEQLWADLQSSVEINSDPYETFVDTITEMMQDVEEITDFQKCYFEAEGKRGKKIVIDGYDFDEADNSCLLFISNFTNNPAITSITKTDIDKLYEKMRAFVENSINGYIASNTEESTPGFALSLELKEKFDEITKFRFYILTDEVISDRVKRIEKDPIEDKPVELNVWDLTKMAQIVSSNMQKEDIEIDLIEKFGRGIPCIKVENCGAVQYEPYLAIMPGDILAKLYIDYGSRLLEGNVRSFLSIKGKINKGIRNTIMNEPDKFFAYNNGIAVTSDEVETQLIDGHLCITKLVNMQIINGGQTTASIASAVLKKESTGEDVFVPMKLSVVSKEDAQEMVPKISRYANSQNKVDEADFFSNHPFHVRMEDYSRKITAPAVAGNQYSTYWFYERARGSYTQEQMKMTKAEKDRFKYIKPKNQMIRKVDLAKYLNTYDGCPDIVSKGSQYNMKEFAKKIETQWEKSDTVFNENYFKKAIALTKLYRTTEALVLKQDWYQQAYRANIVTYSLALLFDYVKANYSDKAINLKYIWNKQEVYPELIEQLVVTTKEVLDFITRNDRPIQNVTEWCKKSQCWENAKKQRWTILPEFIDTLIDSSEEKEEIVEARKLRRVDNGIDYQKEVLDLGSDTWRKLYEWAKQRGLLNQIDEEFLSLAFKWEYTGKFPTDKQCVRILEIRKRLLEEGSNI